ncbi:MAG: SDR family oxidoreductase, partial [Spirochaetales bacterium]|nr:SDR family oxidoreductase [Spirochaetales bacterium]
RAPADELEAAVLGAAALALGLAPESLSMDDDFFASGGDSLKAMRLVAKANWGGLVGIQDVYERRSPAALATLVRERQAERVESARATLAATGTAARRVAMMGRSLGPLIRYHAGRVGAAKRAPAPAEGAVLLTGATGWVGLHLAEIMLTEGSRPLIVLARGRDDAHAASRFAAAYRKAFGAEPPADQARLCVLRGDVRRPRFGLPERQWDELADRTSQLIHAAAVVKHYGAESEFLDTNLGGTVHALEFARHGRPKDLHHLSTLSVADGLSLDQLVLTEDSAALPGNPANPYVMSKVRAENELRASGYDRLWIHRLGNIVCDSRDGSFQANMAENAFYRLLRAFLTLGALPDLPMASFDFTYADTAARAIKAIADSCPAGTYHVRNHRTVSFRDLAGLLSASGRGVTLERPKQFLSDAGQALSDRRTADDAAFLLARMPESAGRPLMVLSGKTARMLAACGIVWRKPDRSLVSRMLSHGQARQFFPNVGGPQS